MFFPALAVSMVIFVVVEVKLRHTDVNRFLFRRIFSLSSQTKRKGLTLWEICLFSLLNCLSAKYEVTENYLSLAQRMGTRTLSSVNR